MAGADAVVAGCGVIGLTAAICLREAGVDAGIVAAELPPGTTSSVAAAIWYPYKAYPEDRVLAWGERAFQVFDGMVDDPETGVILREGFELHRELAPDPWWMDAVPGVRRCEDEEL